MANLAAKKIINKRLISLIISSFIFIAAINTYYGAIIAIPIELLVTYLHEFSHALICLLTGGHVYSLEVNLDGSGVTTTLGGNNALICMGGYIGSCIFSNLLMRFSVDSRLTRIASVFLSISSALVAFKWYSNDLTTTILIGLSVLFLIIARIYKIQSFILQFIAIASLVDIIQDFNVGPTSDLAEFSKEVGLFSQNTWMYIWLVIVILITIWNMRRILKNF